MEKESNVPLITLAIVAIVIIGGLGVLYGKDMIAPEYNVSATVIIDFENGTKRSFENLNGESATAWDLLILASEKGDFEVKFSEWDLGKLVDSIDGVGNGVDVVGLNDTASRYWQYYVNDELALVGAEDYLVEDGDQIEWRFEVIVW